MSFDASFDDPLLHCQAPGIRFADAREPATTASNLEVSSRNRDRFAGPPAAAAPPPGVLHRAMVALDMLGFGRRVPALHPHLRAALYRVTETSFAAVGLPLHACDHDDRGDGILVIAPPDASIEVLLGHLPAHLHAALRRHNQLAAPAAQLRLRLAVNAGYVHLDACGASGRALLHLY